MDYNTQYRCYVVAYKRSLTDFVTNESDWMKLYDILNPLVKSIKGVPNIEANQLLIGTRGQVKLGRLSWNESGIRKIAATYKEQPTYTGDNLFFRFFKCYFPNLKTSVDKKDPPRLIFFLANGFQNSIWGSSLLFCIRCDYLNEVGEENIQNALSKLSVLLTGIKTVYRERPYGYYYGEGEGYRIHTNCLSDLMPDDAIKVTDGKLVVAKNWLEL